MDIVKRKVYRGNQIVHITKIEFDLLFYLLQYENHVLTYQQLYEAVWEEPYTYEKDIIMTHISHLRGKIEPDPSHPQYIENVRGVGYRFKKE